MSRCSGSIVAQVVLSREIFRINLNTNPTQCRSSQLVESFGGVMDHFLSLPPLALLFFLVRLLPVLRVFLDCVLDYAQRSDSVEKNNVG